jgi:hypothetical protein
MLKIFAGVWSILIIIAILLITRRPLEKKTDETE